MFNCSSDSEQGGYKFVVTVDVHRGMDGECNHLTCRNEICINDGNHDKNNDLICNNEMCVNDGDHDKNNDLTRVMIAT